MELCFEWLNYFVFIFVQLTMKKYTPISCVFYEFLEHYATIKKEVEIVYLDDSVKKKVVGVIADLSINDQKKEVLTINDLNIRLDLLISVDGKMLADFNHC